VGEHDENITYERTVEMVGADIAAQIRDKAIALYKAAAEIALKKGIIIADTKFEFGLDKNGAVVLMDEVLTPDSSRYWPATSTPWAAIRRALTSSFCATGWKPPRSMASPGTRRPRRRVCPGRSSRKRPRSTRKR